MENEKEERQWENISKEKHYTDQLRTKKLAGIKYWHYISFSRESI
jgi:hypothetical protein